MAPAEEQRPNAKNMPAATDCTSRCRGRSSLLSRCTAAAQIGGHAERHVIQSSSVSYRGGSSLKNGQLIKSLCLLCPRS